jgi:5-formyltetrahydrofolate cyclo-ligase
LTPGAHGILEPKTSPVDLSSMPRCIIVVPGVAFTSRGARLGRGGGHYDRLLAELSPQAIKVGLAYSFQLLDDIPQSGWDQRLNFVVTESAIYPALEVARHDGGVRAQGGIPR